MFDADGIYVRGTLDGDLILVSVDMMLIPEVQNECIGSALVEVVVCSDVGTISTLHIAPATGLEAESRTVAEIIIKRALEDAHLDLYPLHLNHPNYSHPIGIVVRGAALLTPQNQSAES
ncbi:hypothetical protein A2215_02850 [Candidatus Berkelbacteria bacterium RIFOXYA2_FULL_43_10]|uniref:Uncharacterized protein n=1 Tax=Candidatus Berkelbacteria bacterium RIFOXYA2_FULL_43_10 TaxID=1797472 RepID=A0A1F5E8K1_9BACT|nr:MAG: hypothetical protein A2215_02850 [Candidatus Berkelbacteria bacterium RIFOXYA2_FULL_43_10]